MLEHLRKHSVRLSIHSLIGELTHRSVSSTGIGPESFAYISSDGNYTGNGAPTPQQLAFYKKHGFYISTGGTDYILRPEVLESNFYAWRVSGKTKYLDNAVAAIASFNKYLPATVAFSGISDVTSADSPKYDDMASFWFAEVLKYLWVDFPSSMSEIQC